MPRWSPDGRAIAFVGHPSGAQSHWKIYLVSATGGNPEELAPGDDDQANPTWSPDGASLVFAGAPWLRGFSPASTAIRIFDFATRQISKLPGSEGLWSPRWSPDGRRLLAETVDSAKLLLFDAHTRRWTELLAERNIGYCAWSHDGQYVYFNTFTAKDPAIYRVSVSGGPKETVLSLNGIRTAQSFGPWFALAPDDSPMVLRDTSVTEIYALDVDWP
jgi:Tol biopolymer transport system component